MFIDIFSLAIKIIMYLCHMILIFGGTSEDDLDTKTCDARERETFSNNEGSECRHDSHVGGKG